MSQENVEVVRRVFEDFQAGVDRGDPGAFFDSEAVPEDYEVEVSPAEAIEGRRVWRGREGWLEFFGTWTGEFEGFSVRVERLIDGGGDRVVALTRQAAVGKRSRASVEWALGQVFEFEGGRLVRVRFYPSYADALAAVGPAE